MWTVVFRDFSDLLINERLLSPLRESNAYGYRKKPVSVTHLKEMKIILFHEYNFHSGNMAGGNECLILNAKCRAVCALRVHLELVHL